MMRRARRTEKTVTIELDDATFERFRRAAGRLGAASGRGRPWSDEKTLRFLLDFEPLAEFVDRVRGILSGRISR